MADHKIDEALCRAAAAAACGVPDMTDHGACTGCGQCCGNSLPLTKTDINRIRAYIKQHRIEPVNRIPALMMAPAVDALCPFLDDAKPNGKKCRIYDVRPFVCRHYICSVNSDQAAAEAAMKAMAMDPHGAEAITARQVNMRATFFPDSPDNNIYPTRHMPPEMLIDTAVDAAMAIRKMSETGKE